MPKLSSQYAFLDLSDYGRKPATWIAQILKYTRITSIHMTLLFFLVGCLAIACIWYGYYFYAGILLILKSILDAADGELSRIKKRPSYTGRYLDSICDIILNFGILMSIGSIAGDSMMLIILAFLCIQLQGTLYNYYYVILRHKDSGGDSTSKIIENTPPKAFVYEKQTGVNTLFFLFRILYGVFDYIVLWLDRGAIKHIYFPRWFMTMVSLYGLGWQLLLIACLLWLGYSDTIIIFIIRYTLLLPILLGIRKYILRR